MLHPVILCGGTGTRLWPLSRRAWPKQFVPFLGENSLYQATVLRLSGAGFAAPLVMTAEDFRFVAIDQATAIGCFDAEVVVEPEPRDTGPVILAAAFILHDRDPEAEMLVLPSDHAMSDPAGFLDAVAAGRAAAGQGGLVSFGVTPDRPETGFGYLELAAPPGDRPQPLLSFREKPDRDSAARFLASGRYLWNAGIFLFRARDVIAAYETHAPDLIAPCRDAVDGGAHDLGFFRLAADPYARARAVSVDYAVMERAAADAVAVPMTCGWSDLGSWDAVRALAAADGAGVATDGAVTAIDCRDSYLRSEDPGLHLVGLGLDGVVAVAMRDAVLVADGARVQELREAVTTLRAARIAQADSHPRMHRPWGWYETLCLGSRFQVKRIMVSPGGVLSLQSHHHRAEHWVVVEGTAEVTIGDQVTVLSENQSGYIPLGARHRLRNPGKMALHLIEVQTGSYLGEDDIIRYEDVYHRV